MRKKHVLIGMAGAVLVVCIILVIIAIHNYNNPKIFYPTEGVWYCDELAIQIHFGEVNDNFVKKGDEYIYCQSGSNPGSSLLTVMCQDTDSGYYKLGETVFSGEYISSDDHTFSVRESNGSKVFKFVRLHDYISTPVTQYYIVNANSFSVEEINADIKNTFNNEIFYRGNDSESENIFYKKDFLIGKTLEYELYCANKNRTISDAPYYDYEMYVYIVIKSIDSIRIDQDTETHIFGFCITPNGMQQSFYEEIHSSDENAIAFLANKAEYIGSYSLCIE